MAPFRVVDQERGWCQEGIVPERQGDTSEGREGAAFSAKGVACAEAWSRGRPRVLWGAQVDAGVRV